MISRVLARLVLAYVLALPLCIGLAARSAGSPLSHTLILTMSSSVPGVLQVFLDTGQGFSEAQSLRIPTIVSVDPHEYRLPIPSGTYRHLRIDPGVRAGRFAIAGAAIVDGGGATEAAIPIAGLETAYQLSALERSVTRLVVEAPPGATDPQLLYTPVAPMTVGASRASMARVVARGALIWLAAFGIVWAFERLLLIVWPSSGNSLARLWAWCGARPRGTVVVLAVAGTIVATYPLLFLGRSLVSPNNGGRGMLYGTPPLAPASTDLVMEDVRDSDTAATVYSFVPYTHVQRAALRAGEFPLWNRYNAAGRPMWGQGLSFLLDPLHWLTLITPDPSLGWDLKFVAHRFVFAAGIGLAALSATGAWLPAAVVAFAAPFAGDYAYRLNHPSTFAMTYVPWALLACFRLAAARRRATAARAAVWLALTLALVLVASTPKDGLIALLGTGIAGTVSILVAPGEWALRWRRLGLAAAAGVTMLLLTAPHWLVFLDTLHRAVTLYDVPYIQTGGVANAVAFFLGPLAPGPLLPGLHVLGLVLLAAALTAPRRLVRSSTLLGCALVVMMFTAVAFGLVPTRLILRLPLVGNIGHVYDTFPLAAWPMVLLMGAAGLAALQAGTTAHVLRTTVVMALATAWIVVHAATLSGENAFEPALALLVLGAGILVPGCLASLREGRARILPAVASGAAIVALVLPGGLHLETGLAPLDALLMQPRFRIALDANSPATDTVRRALREPGRAVGVEWVLFSGSQALYELEGFGGPDALKLPYYDELFRTANVWTGWGWLPRVPVADVVRLKPLLDMLNVEYMFALPEEAPASLIAVPSEGPDRVTIGRRPSAWPRAFFTDGVTTYAGPTELLRNVAGSARPLAAVQASDQQAIDATRAVARPPTVVMPATGYGLGTNTTRFHVAATGPGVAVLGESYMPDDFQVTLNGRPAAYFRVDHVFKGVVIPAAGSWDVAFEYRPVHWFLSLALAALGLLLLGGMALAGREPMARRPAVPA